MKKKVLYIISSTVISSSPLGLRIKQWLNYLNATSDVYVMGKMPVQKFTLCKRIFLHALLKLKVVPDRDVFFIPFYKRKIKKTVQNQSFDMAFIQTLPFSNYFLCPFIKKVSPHTQIIVEIGRAHV